MIKVYRGHDGDVNPVELECEVFGYPNRTTTGETMYENTHFLTEDEAWQSILKSVKAGVELAGRDVKDVNERLKKARKVAGEATEEFVTAHDNYRDYLRERKSRERRET